MTTYMDEEVVLNYADIEGNNNKYYKLHIQQEGYGYNVVAEYGRVGKRPQVKKYPANTESEAYTIYSKKKREKLRKGYQEVALLDTNEVTSVTTTPTDNKGKKRTPLQQAKYKRVQRFIRNIGYQAKLYVENHVNMPLGAISITRINEARMVLNQLKADGLNPQEQVRLSNRFYSMIPVMFKGNAQDMLLNSGNKLIAMYDLLDIMEAVAKNATIQQDENEKVLGEMGITLEALSKNTKAYLKLKEKVENSQAPNHRYKVYVKDIFAVQKDEWDEKFNPFKVATKELFHGSLVENYTKILANGLKIKPAGVKLTGSMFGNGIYFADKSTKSASYSIGNFRGYTEKNQSYYMLICEVATGKEYKTEFAKSNLVSAPKGYNSVKGVVGCQLANDEYIVYKESQAKIKYIVEIEVR